MTAQPYNVVAELDVPFDEEVVDQLIEPVAYYGGAVGRSELGRAEVVFTLPADTVRQATTTAMALLERYPWALLSLRVLTAADFDRLADAVELPQLVSVAQAATMLGISRQSVLKAIKEAKLPAVQVGGTWILRESVVQARAHPHRITLTAAESEELGATGRLVRPSWGIPLDQWTRSGPVT